VDVRDGAPIVKDGGVVSMVREEFAPRDPLAPGVGRIRDAAVIPAAVMLPPFNVRAPVEEQSNLVQVSPSETV